MAPIATTMTHRTYAAMDHEKYSNAFTSTYSNKALKTYDNDQKSLPGVSNSKS